ncbi:O-antigen ligase family protein [Agromyces sp. SYSU T00194]|uniref:O-antigen ligase family protein n=1 Tax=Agromyces chitinivorans TaxID=3158560 RepID=UPI00339AF528
MPDARPDPIAPELRRFLGSARFAQALTLAVLGTGFSTHALRSLIGWPGLVAVVVALVALGGVSLVARWKAVDWYGVLPLSLLVFVGWAAASVLWSSYPATTLWRVGYLVAFGLLGVYVALVRDTIQVVRATGDVLRVLLGLSLALEVLSGVLLDLPIAFLGIQGDLVAGGPVQGVFGSRNVLGFVALIAGLTFVVEWRTRSVPRAVALASIALAGAMVFLSGSPTTMVALTVLLIAALALFGLRRARAQTRWRWQVALVTGGVVALAVGFAARVRIIELLDARGEFDVRLETWREMSRYLDMNPMQGWGWAGIWPTSPPYSWVTLATGRPHASGLSAYIDVYFQLGVIGAALFVGLIGLALVRAWLLASARRAVVYVWPALVLVVLAVTSFAESYAVVEGGWMLLVICTVQSARDMSWRDAWKPKLVPAV